MTKFQTAIVSAVVLIAVGLLLWRNEHQAYVRLRGENQSLRQQNEQLVPETERLSNLVVEAKNAQTPANSQMNELLKLRSEVGGLRRLTNQLGKVQEDNQRLKASLASANGRSKTGTTSGDSLPQESWRFAGYADPESALQTAFWAMSQGDAKTILASMSPDGADFKEIAAKPEEALSTEMKAEFAKVAAFKVIDKEVVSNDEVILNTYASGINELARIRLLRAGNEWKVAGRVKDKAAPGAQ